MLQRGRSGPAQTFRASFPVLAADVVGLKPDVILAVATPAAVATRALTKSIPIVCPLLADAVNLGLVATDSRPGGNVTGVSFRTEGLTSKQVELALQMIPDGNQDHALRIDL